jgi:hypothetical protein
VNNILWLMGLLAALQTEFKRIEAHLQNPALDLMVLPTQTRFDRAEVAGHGQHILHMYVHAMYGESSEHPDAQVLIYALDALHTVKHGWGIQTSIVVQRPSHPKDEPRIVWRSELYTARSPSDFSNAFMYAMSLLLEQTLTTAPEHLLTQPDLATQTSNLVS